MSKFLQLPMQRYSSAKAHSRRSFMLMLISIGALIATHALADNIDSEPTKINALQTLIDAAEIDLSTAQEHGNAWLHSEKILARAKNLAAAGDEAGAMALARLAREQSVLAENQAKLERARYLLREQGANYAAAIRSAAEQFLRSYDGAGALHMLSKSR